MSDVKLSDSNKKANFTKADIEALQPDDKKRKYYFDIGGSGSVTGLGLALMPSGVKSFFVRATIDGKSRRISIPSGKFPGMTVSIARQKAKGMLGEIAEGNNPIEQRKKVRREVKREQEITLQKILDAYIGEGTLKPDTAKQYRKRIKYDFNDYMNKPLDAITKEVIQTINRERQAKAGPAMRAVKALFNYAKVQYEDDGLFQINPVDIIRKTKTTHKYRRKKTYIKKEDFTVWFDAVDQQSTIYRQYFLFLLLTGVRSDSEAGALTWGQINWRSKTFKLIDTKNRDDVELPLPDHLIPDLKQRKGKPSEKVFPIENYGYTQRKEIVAKSGVEFSRHDLRRTFLTVGESLDISYLTVKRLANHRDSENDVTAGYIPINLDRLKQASRKIERFILTTSGRLNAEVKQIYG